VYRDIKDLQYFLEKETYEKLAGKSRKEIGEWYERVGGYLHAGVDGNLVVDAEAQSLGVPLSSPEFFGKTIGNLDNAGQSPLARKLLERYVPEGAGKEASAERWRSWVKENKQYLFFSDTGGYRWYVDPLAKKRGVPTALLRGPARATLPAKS
jgi:hypothetical protein